MVFASATPTGSPVRVAGVYATRWRYREPTKKDQRPAPVPFTGTRFEKFAKVFEDQLPRLPKLIAPMQDVSGTFHMSADGLAISKAEVYLFALPSDQVVASLVLECISTGSSSFDAMLDDFTLQTFSIDGDTLSEFLISMAPKEYVENLTNPYVTPPPPRRLRRLFRIKPGKRAKARLHDKLPEQHEIVYLPEWELLDERGVEQLLYRTKEGQQKEFSRQHNVPELSDQGLTQQNNLRMSLAEARKVGIVSTRASLIKGHDPLVEDSVLLSAVQAVGTLARFRDIWDRAFELVNKFRNDKLADDAGVQQRDDLEKLVDELGNLEFDLTFSVEFPLMRVETYHKELSEALDVTRQAKRLSEMFGQISGSVRSEITAIDIRDARKNELRTRRNEIVALVLTSVAVPIGVLLAFFGINAREVKQDLSIFDERYYPAYAVAIGLMLVPPIVAFLSMLWARALRRRERKRAAEGI